MSRLLQVGVGHFMEPTRIPISLSHSQSSPSRPSTSSGFTVSRKLSWLLQQFNLAYNTVTDGVCCYNQIFHVQRTNIGPKFGKIYLSYLHFVLKPIGLHATIYQKLHNPCQKYKFKPELKTLPIKMHLFSGELLIHSTLTVRPKPPPQ